ncbi:cryptochrome/photolyase family protein, partial [Vibrio anguillarum]|nr:cryptochrome/photolyase family protein [Vibrio anguillarum]
MSDYCKDCHYQVKSRSGLNSCPFNSLYWQFMLTHRERLAKNPRIGMIYKNWDNTENATQQAILDQAQYYLHHIEEL